VAASPALFRSGRQDRSHEDVPRPDRRPGNEAPTIETHREFDISEGEDHVIHTGNAAHGGGDRIVVVTPDGMAVTGTAESDEANPATQVEQPAKVMRIGCMIKQLLDEVRNAPLDDAGRARLAKIHERSILELEQGLAPELVEELRRITLPFSEEQAPSDAELRIAQAQLVGWLEGLFHGIQTALFAQQVAARTQLEQMRRALPGGQPNPLAPEMAGQPAAEGERGTGQYL
jgi:hypothetical protein